MINILIARDEERKADYEKRIEHLQKQINKLDEHLMFRERVIERKDEVIERLLKKVIDV
jgi:ABC-type Zn uptake system ZnuABC Zn-binding protein ZnuA